MTNDSSLTVQDIGEQGLLRRLQNFCPSDLVGDDAALLSVDGGRSLVVSTDVLVNTVHFSDRTTSPADAGWRAVAANLSDLAAMGAEPLAITVGLSVPGDLSVEWVDQLYQGMAECLTPWNTPIVGGDICRSPVISIAITALGQVVPDRAIRRSTAQPHQAILVTGEHGASRAGLELLLQPEQGQMLSNQDRLQLIRAHQRPQPRLDVIPHLWQSFEAHGRSPQMAGMDSSDGLADAVLQLCRASGVGARLDRHQIPFPASLKSWLSHEQILDWALYGGEDFELVLCLPQAIAQSLIKQLGNGAAIVGVTTAETEVVLTDSTGNSPDMTLTLEQGFQHF